jgi:hypothetical protein
VQISEQALKSRQICRKVIKDQSCCPNNVMQRVEFGRPSIRTRTGILGISEAAQFMHHDCDCHGGCCWHGRFAGLHTPVMIIDARFVLVSLRQIFSSAHCPPRFLDFGPRFLGSICLLSLVASTRPPSEIVVDCRKHSLRTMPV